MATVLLYVHVPFCPSKCHFCFKTQHIKSTQLLDKSLHGVYATKTIENVHYLSELHAGYQAIGINWGGGTPSVLSPRHIEVIGKTISRYWPIGILPFSVEMTPDTATQDVILSYKNLGCKRISLGAQTFNDETLRKMWRSHSTKDIEQSLELIRYCGITHINVDIILALPSESLADNAKTLRHIIDLNPPHITTYFYHPASGSVLYRRLASGKERLWSTTEYLDAVSLVQNMLGAAGYQHYEYFHWSKNPEQYHYTCIDHYFGHKGDTIGFGPDAHSYISGIGNLVNPHLERFLLEPKIQTSGPFDLEFAIERALGCNNGIRYEAIARTYGLSIEAVQEHSLIKKIKTLRGISISANGITMPPAEYVVAHTLGISRRFITNNI